jgi:4-alpha-glucanotransferase
MKLLFYLRFHTRYGQRLYLSGNIEELGNNDPGKRVPMEYLNEEFWSVEIEVKRKDLPKTISYTYSLEDENGAVLNEWGHDRTLEGFRKDVNELQAVDTWNHPSFCSKKGR